MASTSAILDRMVHPAAQDKPLGTCQICGSGISPRYWISATSRWNCESDFHVYWCRECDAGFLLPRPSRELLESLYSRRYFSEYGTAVAAEQSVLDRLRVNLAWRVDHSIALDANFMETIANSSSAKICDLGCGKGRLLEKLRAHGFQVVGVEPSPFAREEVESKGIKVYEGTAESLPSNIREAPFDVVVMSHVLEHCLDVRHAIGHALELLRTGGHLVIEVPNCDSFQFETRGPAWFHFDVGRHVNYFTPGALERLVGEHPTEVVRYYYRQYLEHFLSATLALEISLWDWSYREEDGDNLTGIPRPSKLRSWMSLLRSFALRPDRKYQAVGIVVRKK